MKKIPLLVSFLLLFLVNCSSPSAIEKSYSISELKYVAKDGEMVKSQGELVNRTEKRKFEVSDGENSVIIDLKKFKKQTKILDKGDKIIFSGRIQKKALNKPEIEVVFFKKVENFK